MRCRRPLCLPAARGEGATRSRRASTWAASCRHPQRRCGRGVGVLGGVLGGAGAGDVLRGGCGEGRSPRRSQSACRRHRGSPAAEAAAAAVSMASAARRLHLRVRVAQLRTLLLLCSPPPMLQCLRVPLGLLSAVRLTAADATASPPATLHAALPNGLCRRSSKPLRGISSPSLRLLRRRSVRCHRVSSFERLPRRRRLRCPCSAPLRLESSQRSALQSLHPRRRPRLPSIRGRRGRLHSRFPAACQLSSCRWRPCSCQQSNSSAHAALRRRPSRVVARIADLAATLATAAPTCSHQQCATTSHQGVSPARLPRLPTVQGITHLGEQHPEEQHPEERRMSSA